MPPALIFDLDGTLADPVWQETAWSSSFVDISTATPPRLDTRVKIRWDDHALYVGARLEESVTEVRRVKGQDLSTI